MTRLVPDSRRGRGIVMTFYQSDADSVAAHEPAVLVQRPLCLLHARELTKGISDWQTLVVVDDFNHLRNDADIREEIADIAFHGRRRQTRNEDALRTGERTASSLIGRLVISCSVVTATVGAIPK